MSYHILMDGQTKKAVPNALQAYTAPKKEAEAAAREQSKREGTELFIHGKDGQIQRKDSHGNDPKDIKG